MAKPDAGAGALANVMEKSGGGESETAAGSVVAYSEYDEYQRLRGLFVDDRLKRLQRKLDWHILPQLIIIYLLCYIDRANAGNAKTFKAAVDLHMSGQQWNTALSVYFITYAFGCVPANMALKKIGPRLWLSTMVLAVSIVLICSSLQNNMGGWTAFRVLLGAVEAGVWPGCSYVLTTWFSPAEVHTRMTIFYSGASAAGAFGGLLAYAIGQADGVWGYHGWRWIYCLEGLFTFFVAIAGYWVVYDTPEKAGKWLSDEEKRFVVLRHKFAAGGETGVAEQQKFAWKYAKQSLKSPHVYAIALIEFTIAVVVYGTSFVLPTIIVNLGYSAARAQAMTAPPYIFACLCTLLSGWAADRYKKRMLSIVIPNTMAMIGFIIILVSVRFKHIPGVTLFGIFLGLGGLYPISPAVTAWISLNQAGETKRAVSLAWMITLCQLGGIMGSNIYISNQAPTYPVGFGISIGMLGAFGIIWPILYWAWLKHINSKRAAMSTEEIFSKYTDADLAEMGDESPLFRYAT